jgi:hypothetical protein
MWVDYNGETMRVFVNNQGDLKPVDAQLEIAVDLTDFWDGRDVIVGYTAGTFSQADNQDILSWSIEQPS